MIIKPTQKQIKESLNEKHSNTKRTPERNSYRNQKYKIDAQRHTERDQKRHSNLCSRA
jgi:hypothetical protein